MHRLFFVRFAGNSFHPKWPKLISLRPKLISPRPKPILPNRKNLCSKARNSFPETQTLKFSRFCVFCLQKWHSKGQKVIYSTLYLVIFIHSNKKVKIYVKRTHQRGRNSFQKGWNSFPKGWNSFHKMPKLIFSGFCASGRDLILHKKKPAYVP